MIDLSSFNTPGQLVNGLPGWLIVLAYTPMAGGAIAGAGGALLYGYLTYRQSGPGSLLERIADALWTVVRVSFVLCVAGLIIIAVDGYMRNNAAQVAGSCVGAVIITATMIRTRRRT